MDLAVEDDEEAAVAGVAEGCALEGGVVLCGGWEGCAEVGSLLQGLEDGVADLLADGVADRAGAEELAERAVGLDLADVGDELELGFFGDLRGELDLDLCVACNDTL